MRCHDRFFRVFVLLVCGCALGGCLRADGRTPPNPAKYRAVRIKKVPLESKQRRLLDKYRLKPYESVYPDGGEGIKFVMAEPAGQLGRTQKVPLVLFLHGLGEHGPDLTRLLKQPAIFRLAGAKFQKKHPCWFLAPQSAARKERFDSYDIHNPAEAMQETMDIINWMVRNAQPAVDRNRIYVVGLSSGGRAAFDATVYFPKAFAAVVPIATIYSVSRINEKNVNHYWLIYNRESMDERVWKLAQKTKKKVEELGGEFIIGQYAGKGHDAWNDAFSEPRLWDWVFAQNRDRSKTKSLNTSTLARLRPRGADKTPPMRASSTLESEGSNAPERAVDGLLKSMFVSTAPAKPGEYWQVEFNPAIIRRNIRILSGDNRGKRVPKGCKVMTAPFKNMFQDAETIRGANTILEPSRPVRFLRVVVPEGFSGPLILREVLLEGQ